MSVVMREACHRGADVVRSGPMKSPLAPLAVFMLLACGGGPPPAGDTGTTGDAGTAGAPTTGAPTAGAGTSGGTTAGEVTTGAATAGAGTTEGSTAGTSAAGTSGTTAAATSGAFASEDPRVDVPPACEPTTCEDAGKTCGALPDGCGGELECGRCDAPDTCGGGGVDNVCGRPCVAVRVIFFDLGDTLVEPDGGGQFVERPGVSGMIAELMGLGMRIGVITNTPDGYTLQDLEDLLVNPGLLDAFEVVVLSSQAASPPKPAPQIFAEAYGLLIDAPPIAQVAYVSESLAEIADQEAAPTQGARAAGMLGVHLSSAPPSPLADYTLAPDQLDMLVTLAGTEWLDCEGSP